MSGGFMKFLIDRNELPYDAMVPDASWLIPIEDNEEEGDGTDDEKTDALQADQVHGEDVSL